VNRLQRAAQQVNVVLDDTVVIMKLSDGSYFQLNEVGARIWNELVDPVDVDSLVARLLDAYDIDEPTCRAEVDTWLQKMQELGLVVPAA
jgi:hypothetical protein